MGISTIRKYFKSGWRVTAYTTYVSSTSPSIFERYVAVSTPIVVRLRDDQYNIDFSSIKLYINNWDATNACTIMAVSGGYQIRYLPTVNWYWSHRITVKVLASNSKGISMAPYQFYFDVTARKIGDLIEEAVLKISQKTDWTKL